MQSLKGIMKKGFAQAFRFWVALSIAAFPLLPLSGCGVGVGNPYIPGITSPRYTELGYGTLYLKDGSSVTGLFRLNNKNYTYEEIVGHGKHLHWSWATAPVKSIYPVSLVKRFVRH